MELKEIILFSTALLAIVNPLGSAVLFAAVARQFHPRLDGADNPMLQAAGGLILLNYGLRMVTVEDTKLTQSEQDSAQDVAEEHWKAPAVVRLRTRATCS